MIKEAFISLYVATCAHAHSLHQSTAEAEYNPTTKKLEVSLTVFINDLETALVRQSEREMRLDKTPAAEFDAQIQAYLAKAFVVSDASGKAAKIEWVGRELDADSVKSGDPAVTLFFQVSLPGGLKGVSLRNEVLHKLFVDQVNLMLFRHGTEKTPMTFQRGSTSQRVE